MIEILSSGQGELEAFILPITFAICLYDGGDKSYGIVGWTREGIQEGIVRDFNVLRHRKNLWKNCVYVNESKFDVGDVFFLKLAFLYNPRNSFEFDYHGP